MLDHETRQYLRQQISQHKLKKLNGQRKTEPFMYCLKCGCDKGTYTPGCTSCSDRRRRSARTVPCLSCGKAIRQYTMWRRASRGWPSANVQQCRECLKGKCKGCGTPIDQRTRGCPPCRYRHHKRTLRHRHLEQTADA